MPYCDRCGRQIPFGAAYCPECGAPVISSSRKPGSYSRPYENQSIEEHWFARILAYVIDSIVFYVFVGVPLFILGFPLLQLFFFPFNGLSSLALSLVSVAFVLYFAVAEYYFSTTIGKMLLGLRVQTTNRMRPDLGKTLVRNISKIVWILLLLDVVLGYLDSPGSGQKFSDRFSNTVVTR